MRRRTAALIALTAALSACTTVRHPHQPAAVLHCENGETVEVGYAGDLAIVTYKNRKHTMRTAISGSGARYVGEGLEWWTKGFEEGTIAVLPPGEQVSTGERVVCRAGPPPE
ncbi:MliC family protein [Phenylobacterium sp.]|uniref:MliC family protein n=1 Tax=Phenylobacterium sp. TaxID=1871053 RepID=UPI0035B3DE01